MGISPYRSVLFLLRHVCGTSTLRALAYEGANDKGEHVASDESILTDLGKAAAELVRLADPVRSPDDPSLQDDWDHAVPLNWKLQLRFMWVNAADAFDLVAFTLPRRASPTLLAQIRFLLEGYCIVSWLTASSEEVEERALAFAGSEVTDIKNVLLKWRNHDEDRQPTLDALEHARAEIQERGKERTIPRKPSTQQLIETYYSKVAHNLLSDVGSHPGLSSVTAFFLQRDGRTIDPNMHSAVAQRTYFLGMAFELYALLAFRVCSAQGWDEMAKEIRAHHDATGGLLKSATEIIQ